VEGGRLPCKRMKKNMLVLEPGQATSLGEISVTEELGETRKSEKTLSKEEGRQFVGECERATKIS